MERAEFDWKNTFSQFEHDEVYERINAPKWIDLSAPDAAVDDTAWFCRPDCRHPVSAEDFDRFTTFPNVKLSKSNCKLIQSGDHNNDISDVSLKRRAIPPLISSPVKPKLNSKKYNEDLENQNPNMEATPPALKGKRAAIAKKEAIKSSAEKKRGVEEEDRREAQNKRSQPDQLKLKSTFSTRNLFSGRDILSQISEFCHELKKLAIGKESFAAGDDEEKMNIIDQEKENPSVSNDMDEKKTALVSMKKSSSLLKNCELAVKLENNNNEDKRKVLREARAFPPTPQRFHSPSSHRLLQSSKSSPSSNSSPLCKLPKLKTPERSPLQERDPRSEEKRELIPKNEECNRASVTCVGEGSAVDLFWFLKPCSYLV